MTAIRGDSWGVSISPLCGLRNYVKRRGCNGVTCYNAKTGNLNLIKNVDALIDALNGRAKRRAGQQAMDRDQSPPSKAVAIGSTDVLVARGTSFGLAGGPATVFERPGVRLLRSHQLIAPSFCPLAVEVSLVSCV